MGGGHSANGETGDEQGDQAIEQEGLALIPLAEVAPDEGQDEDGSQAVEIVNGGYGTTSSDVEGEPSENLNGDQHLTNRESAGDAARQDSAAQEAHEAPTANGQHKEEDGRGEAVVNEDERVQVLLLCEAWSKR